jgi:hypothetical protein
MEISDVKRQGLALAVLSRRLGLARRQGLGSADFKFKLSLLSHCRLNWICELKNVRLLEMSCAFAQRSSFFEVLLACRTAFLQLNNLATFITMNWPAS